MDSHQKNDQGTNSNLIRKPTKGCQCIDWYTEGEERIVEADGIRVVIRFVGRKGRRGRIAITAPPGAAFLAGDRTPTIPSTEYLV